MITLSCIIVAMNEKKPLFHIGIFLALFTTALFVGFCIPSTEGTLRNPLYLAIFFVVVLIVILFGAFCGSGRERLQKDGLLPGIWNRLTVGSVLAGIFIKICYVLYTQVWDRQHDVVDFHVGEGQAAYIEYFLTNRHLPDFDPRSIWGFFQPPLHHILSAIWMKINLFLGFSERQAQENIQVLTFFYMGALMLITYEICRELGLKERGMCIALSIVSLHPVYILLSGSINNDALSLLLMVLSLYLVMLWYRKERIWLIVLLALSIGLAMFAKLSGAMIAPAVAALFILKLVKEKGRRGKLLLQYVIFGVICVPIGLFYTVRNMILFDMPVNYIPEVGQQFSEYPFWARLFDFRLESVFPAMLENGDAFYEHNVFLALIKTSLFGEYNYVNLSKGFAIPSVLLFISAILLALTAFFATLYLLFSKKSVLKNEWKWLFGVLYATLLFSYFSFALSYSNFSAQDFRYAALIIVIEAIMLGIVSDGKDAETAEPMETAGVSESAESLRSAKAAGTAKASEADRDRVLLMRMIKGSTAVFCICSLIVYFMLGFYKP